MMLRRGQYCRDPRRQYGLPVDLAVSAPYTATYLQGNRVKPPVSYRQAPKAPAPSVAGDSVHGSEFAIPPSAAPPPHHRPAPGRSSVQVHASRIGGPMRLMERPQSAFHFRGHPSQSPIGSDLFVGLSTDAATVVRPPTAPATAPHRSPPKARRPAWERPAINPAARGPQPDPLPTMALVPTKEDVGDCSGSSLKINVREAMAAAEVSEPGLRANAPAEALVEPPMVVISERQQQSSPSRSPALPPRRANLSEPVA